MEVKEIFGRRLRQSRQKARLSLDELCARMNGIVTKQTVSKYENGKVMASSNVIAALAQVLGEDIEYFTRPFNFNIDTIEISFRKKYNVGKKDEKMLKMNVQTSVEQYLELEKILNIDSHIDIIEEETNINDPQVMKKLATRVREKWFLGYAPIASASELLIMHGVKVFGIEGPKGFDGVSGKANDSTYIIVYNTNVENTERRRFTIFHEFAHLIANDNFDKKLSEHDKENLCHAFASELLLPEAVLNMRFGKRLGITLSELEFAQYEYGISIDAIMNSLFRNGIISDKRYRSYCIRKHTEFGLKERLETSRFKERETDFNTDTIYTNMVRSALSRGLISQERAKEFMRDKKVEINYSETSI